MPAGAQVGWRPRAGARREHAIGHRPWAAVGEAAVLTAPAIDAHQHFARPAAAPIPLCPPALRRCGGHSARTTCGPSSRSTASAAPCSSSSCPRSRRPGSCWRLAASVPYVLGVVGWVDLTTPDVGVVLEELRTGPGGRLPRRAAPPRPRRARRRLARPRRRSARACRRGGRRARLRPAGAHPRAAGRCRGRAGPAGPPLRARPPRQAAHRLRRPGRLGSCSPGSRRGAQRERQDLRAS